MRNCNCRYYDSKLNACAKYTKYIDGDIPILHLCNSESCADFVNKFYCTIEEIEQEYKEWCVNLLKVRFDLKPEYYDPHHHNNFTFENCADCLWNKIKSSIEELLEMKNKQQ